MMIPVYPNFAPMSFALRPQFHEMFLRMECGISAFAFSNIFLFRDKYNYTICFFEGSIVIAGEENGKSFFSILGDVPPQGAIDELLGKCGYWKNISEKQFGQLGGRLAAAREDRGNFEYVYSRAELAELPGKNFQKKRNLVNAFAKAHKDDVARRVLDADTLKDAVVVLDIWKRVKGLSGDYNSAMEALEMGAELGLSGSVFYVKGIPAGYCQGEALADGNSFAVHFEKAVDEYKGLYQYINQEFAKSLPANIEFINREQDLGDEGLRQAKMTYRPARFVKLFSTGVI